MNSQLVSRYLPVTLFIISSLLGVVNGTITLAGRTPALSFDDEQAFFGPEIAEWQGLLHVARPLDACTPLNNLLLNISSSNFALIKMGGCSEQQKVRAVQAAGFDVAVMYDEYSDWVPTMEGNNEDIKIPTIFVARESGETLLEIASYTGVDVKITANDENVDHSPWIHPVTVVITLLIVDFLVIALIINESPDAMMYFRRLLLTTEPSNPEPPTYVQIQHPPRMSRSLVRALPCVVYNSLVDRNSTDTTCVICMEDFRSGAKLHVLPCNHRFHKKCIDAWLTRWQVFCPICKHDAREKMQNPSASVSSPINCISITNQDSSSYALQRGLSTNYGSFDLP